MIKFNVPTKEEVSEKNKELFTRMEKSIGTIPNLYATMAYSDNALAKYMAFQNCT